MKPVAALGLAMLLVSEVGAAALAQPDEEAVAAISEADGNITICPVGEECRPAESGDRIFEGTRVRTAATSGRIEIREIPRAEFGEGDEPVMLTLADETELWFVPEGYAGAELPEEGTFEVIQGWVRAAVRGRKLADADLTIRKLGRFWQTGTGASCGPKGTDYVISHDPETGTMTVTVGEGTVVCAMPDGDERAIGVLERMELGPDDIGQVTGISAQEWSDILGFVDGEPASSGADDAAAAAVAVECPATVGKLPSLRAEHRPGSEMSAGFLECSYQQVRKGKRPALGIGLSVQYFPLGVNLNAMAIYDKGYCWTIHGQEPEEPGQGIRAAKVYPVGDRYISGKYGASGDDKNIGRLLKQAKAAAEELIIRISPIAEKCPPTVTIDAITGVADAHAGEGD